MNSLRHLVLERSIRAESVLAQAGCAACLSLAGKTTATVRRSPIETEHDTLFSPPACRTRYIWHLIGESFETKLETFLRDGLWLARLVAFGDADEGRAPDGTLDILDEVLCHQKGASDLVRKQFADSAAQCFASCWHANNGDPSGHAWDQFGDAGAGLAIRSTGDRLLAVLRPFIEQGLAYFGSVAYIDRDYDAPKIVNVIAAAFMISRGLSSEEEARALLSLTDGRGVRLYQMQNDLPPEFRKLVHRQDDTNGVPRFTGATDNGNAIVIPAPAKELIEEVLIGCYMATAQRNRLEARLDELQIPYRVLASDALSH